MNTQVAVLWLCTPLYGTLCAWKTYLKSRTKWRSGNKNNHVASHLFQRSADIFIRKPLGHIPAANLPSLRRWASVLISGLSYNHLHLWKFTVNYGTSELCCLTPMERRCKWPATAEINREQIRCATLINVWPDITRGKPAEKQLLWSQRILTLSAIPEINTAQQKLLELWTTPFSI